ncbi:MAG: phosphate signaling complex protein PhoU [Coriobacteriia bacterium]|nr:phosphate signaling complex protein PhoU [Coriobacteriia bacterium]MCL2749890.1 phosphate signaling complex protein PhoU [Coriobacteriia bacterium]
MRAKFDEQLEELNGNLVEMGLLVKKVITEAVEALIKQDVSLAKKIMSMDDEIDQREQVIESLCLQLILQQQPVSGDLRLVSTVLKISSDLERIGDHATDISELAILLSSRQCCKRLEYIPQMAEITMQMVADGIDAFVRKDIDLAHDVIARDDKVDRLFDTIKNDLVDQIRNNEHNSDQAIDLILVAKYFERIGDHATNIAEWVVFLLTGMHKDSKIL